jgi:TRAP-type mannitol/chloroaromatic compound transport system permease small subunit
MINQLNEHVGRAVAWLTAALVLLICYDVFSRYALSHTAAWTMELEWHLFALIFLLGAGYAFRHDRHVRVDLFYANFSAREQALVNLLGGLLFLLPLCLVLLYASWHYAWMSFLIREGSPDPGGLPARYLIKFSIVLAIGLLFLQGLASVIDAGLLLASSDPATSDDHPQKTR